MKILFNIEKNKKKTIENKNGEKQKNASFNLFNSPTSSHVPLSTS